MTAGHQATGGRRLFSEKYGRISIPSAHAHLGVTAVERDLWLDCMARALAQQDYPESLVGYLLKELAVPAERIRQVTEAAEGKLSPATDSGW